MKILTLCYRCKDLYSEAYSLKPYKMSTATTKLKDKCDSCGKKYGTLEQFIVSKKGK